eukprot:COSAG02_NODE_2023_length_10085_cov_2.117565_3_plen_201_part_00
MLTTGIRLCPLSTHVFTHGHTRSARARLLLRVSQEPLRFRFGGGSSACVASAKRPVLICTRYTSPTSMFLMFLKCFSRPSLADESNVVSMPSGRRGRRVFSQNATSSYDQKGKQSGGSLAQVPITKPRGQVEVWQARYDNGVPIDLHGGVIDSLTYSLSNQDGDPVNLQGSDFNATLRTGGWTGSRTATGRSHEYDRDCC